MFPTVEDVKAVLENVFDPEIPVLTITDLGVVRGVAVDADGSVEVTITPTYSGCPAMDLIKVNIIAALQDAGYEKVTVVSLLSPAWTTAWMTEAGKSKLKSYGIAPPENETVDKHALLGEPRQIECPNCGSKHTELVSQFGSTACKSLFRCIDCREPFDYFKCH